VLRPNPEELVRPTRDARARTSSVVWDEDERGALSTRNGTVGPTGTGTYYQVGQIPHTTVGAY
jgi:hypothetical protein